MGASEQKAITTNVNKQLVINQSTIDLTNEQNNTAVANTIVNNASRQTAQIVQSQKMTFSKLHAKGDITISGASQKQEAAITFKSLNINDTTNDASNAMLTSMFENLKQKVDSDVLTKMLANAESKVKVGALQMPGWASTQTTTSNISDTELKNTTDYKLKNIISNTIVNNFTTNNVTDCISSVTNSQNILVSDLKSSDGSITLTAFSQEQSGKLLAECIAKNGVSNKILTNLQNIFGVTITDDKKTTSTTEQTGVSTSSTETVGLLDSVGNMLSSVFGSVFTGYATIGAISLVSSICCCCCILILVFLILFAGGVTGD